MGRTTIPTSKQARSVNLQSKIRLHDLFDAKQKEMSAVLRGYRKVTEHPVYKGNSVEEKWRDLLKAHLPSRYQVDEGIVIDSNDSKSEQIDLIVFDRQYSPLLFESGGAKYVPAESVYAVFEIKQELNKDNFLYASKKIQSVRTLKRTSRDIVHAGGVYSSRQPFNILGGILTTESAWSPPFGKIFLDLMTSNTTDTKRIDLGCVLTCGGFVFRSNPEKYVDVSSSNSSLVHFILNLLSCLQTLGTVPAIDYESYMKYLTTK